ncbi:MAG: hypothetical protein JW881_21275 [Spirochaetales bacterium]|nr:hypothetical protein [Spirochaetales bacterium]
MKKAVILLVLILAYPLCAENKPIVTVMDFTTSGVSKSEMRSIISFLSSALFKTDKFILIDIQERDSLLREMEFSISGCSDETCLLEIGKLLSAEYIVTGNIGKVGSRYLVTIKLLQTETGRTMNTVEGVYAGIDEIVDDLYKLAERLSGGETKAIASETKEDEKTKPDKTVKSDEKKKTNPDIVPDGDAFRKDTESRSPAMAVGCGAGVTIPFGDLNTALGITVTPLAYLDFLSELGWATFGYGLLFGFQYHHTTDDYPDPFYEYGLTSLPVAFHIRLSFDIAAPFFLACDVSAGFTVNDIQYESGEVDDLVTTKLFASPGVSAGVAIGNDFFLYLYNNIIAIAFDNSAYFAYSAGLAVQLNY